MPKNGTPSPVKAERSKVFAKRWQHANAGNFFTALKKNRKNLRISVTNSCERKCGAMEKVPTRTSEVHITKLSKSRVFCKTKILHVSLHHSTLKQSVKQGPAKTTSHKSQESCTARSPVRQIRLRLVLQWRRSFNHTATLRRRLDCLISDWLQWSWE